MAVPAFDRMSKAALLAKTLPSPLPSLVVEVIFRRRALHSDVYFGSIAE
jgi:hypothetical protein